VEPGTDHAVTGGHVDETAGADAEAPVEQPFQRMDQQFLPLGVADAGGDEVFASGDCAADGVGDAELEGVGDVCPVVGEGGVLPDAFLQVVEGGVCLAG